MRPRGVPLRLGGCGLRRGQDGRDHGDALQHAADDGNLHLWEVTLG